MRSSIWPAIHPRILALIREHRSTIVFTNSRRLAERLAQRLNELAGEELVRAHHGSIAREQRLQIEEELKAGRLPALVATSSLELGIDMGAVDLVIQVESPTSVARGLQRIGRAGHQVGEPSKGVIFPKYRGDLLETAVVVKGMHDGAIESTTLPRNPLDVLAQQVVAMTLAERFEVDELLDTVRRAAPFETLTREALEGVLGMLAGAYPSDEFAELKPRITWDRLADTVEARRDARVVAITSGGTIPDRGLYPVFLEGERGHAGTKGRRAGRGDGLRAARRHARRRHRPGRQLLAGRGHLAQPGHGHARAGHPRQAPVLARRRRRAAGGAGPADRRVRARTSRRTSRGGRRAGRRRLERLRREHDLDDLAAENLLAYLEDERTATGVLPTDRRIVIERFRDELGDWRLVILTPFGGRVHAPWCMAIEARLQERLGLEVQTIWSDDGIAIRLPEGDGSLDGVEQLLFPDPEEVEDLVVGRVGQSSLFASRFRENAARALLLPRRRPGTRTPLWQQRQRSADLLAVASRYGSFPILVETYRECLADVFDLPALREILGGVQRRELAVHSVETARASAFASSLLFDYVAAYMYDGDAPMAERRAQALTLDRDLLRELLGQEELRELLDAGCARGPGAQPPGAGRGAAGEGPGPGPRPAAAPGRPLRRGGGRAHGRRARGGVDPPGRAGGDPAGGAGADRGGGALDRDRGRRPVPGRRRGVRAAGRAGGVPGAGAGRARRAPGAVRPDARALPGPEPARRWGLPGGVVEDALHRLVAAGSLLSGEFRPGGAEREYCDPEVLRLLRRRSLAKLRREVEPVDPVTLARFLPAWHGVAPSPSVSRRTGTGGSPFRGSAALERLAEVVDQLAGLPIPASVLERDVLPARIPGYQPRLLDELGAMGEVAWVGRGSLGRDDGRVVLYRPGRELLRPTGLPDGVERPSGEIHERLRAHLRRRGACFYRELSTAAGGARTARCSTRCGTSSGRARSPTTRSRPCAPCAGSGPRRITARGPAG